MAVAIFDGHYLLYRCLFVPQLRVLSSSQGKPVGATFGFIKSIRSTIGHWKEIKSVVVVFDGGRSKRRKEIFPGYKVRERDDTVDEDGYSIQDKLRMNLGYLKFILPKLGIKVVVLGGKEGDDVVGLLAKGIDAPLKIVASDDKDMQQMVSPTVHVWRPMAEERIYVDNFEQLVGCKQEHWFLRKSLLGDSSDKIPGIKGVGPKTVDKALELCPDIGPYPHTNFFAIALAQKSKKLKSIGENFEVFLRNYKLINIDLEEFTDEEREGALARANARAEFDVLTVKRVFTGFEFFSLLEDFPHWISRFQILT